MIGVLTHLNAVLAGGLLCTLLFIDEAGVPLPFAPNEVLLLLAGLLIATGVLQPWLFLPMALLAMAAGMITGFAWAKTLGAERLQSLAERIDAEKLYQRAVGRLRSASPRGIAISRVIPGVRVYATLAAAVSGMELRRFLLGALPALVLWLGALVLVGDLVGRPAEAVISRADNLIVTGALLILLGTGAFLVLRKLPRARIEDNRWNGVPSALRVVLALGLDGGIIAVTVTGVTSVAGNVVVLLREGTGVLGLGGLVVVAYAAGARKGAGATLGEGLFTVDYRSLVKALRAISRREPSDLGGDQRASASDQRRGGDGQQPGDQDAARNSPAHGPEAPGGAGAHHRS